MITLYHVAGARSMRSLWLLNELGLSFKLVEMPFDLSVLRTPEYLAISPLGRVPALTDGPVTLIESGAIAQYLCETYDDGQMGRPPGHPERVKWLQWIHFAETMAVHGASLVQQTVFIAPAERSPTVAKLEGRRLEKALGVIEAEVTDKDYLLPTGFSAADVGVGYSIYLAKRFMELSPFPKVSDYFARLAARPAFQKSLPKANG